MAYTNIPDWFKDCCLDSSKHELWWIEGDHETEQNFLSKFKTLDTNKIYFILSCEGQTLKIAPRPNLFLFDSVISDQKTIYPWMMHWHQTIYISSVLIKKEISLNDKLSISKELVYDGLLGYQRTHRDFAYNWLLKHKDISGVLTYYKNEYGKEQFLTNLNKDNFTHSKDSVEVSTIYNGNQLVPFSKIIPDNIYNKTYVSIITETCEYNGHNVEWDPLWSHYTEKICKPILAQRPFIVLANKGYLRRLKTLGFKTFDSIINEDYDLIDDNETRWEMALEQLYVFQDFRKNKNLQKEVDKITKHNYNIMTLQDWNEFTKKSIRDIATK